MIRISLIPYRAARRQRLFKSIVTIWGVVLVLGLASIFWVDTLYTDRIAAMEAAKKENEAVIAVLDRQLGEIKDIEEKKRQIQARMKVIRSLNQMRVLSIHALDELTTTIPAKVWLTQVTTRNDSMTLNGMAQSNALVADFMQNLESSPYFSNVELTRVSQQVFKDDKLKSFSLELKIGMPQPREPEGKGGK